MAPDLTLPELFLSLNTEHRTSMRSQHVDSYNHDTLARNYDANVQRTEDPIREGYDQVLDWVIDNAGIGLDAVVLELGSGTGNLTKRITECAQIVCVDISTKMNDLAAEKVTHLANREFVVSDVLEFLVGSPDTFDVILSTYTLHHLTEQEKMPFLEAAAAHLSSDGCLVVGDLMSESADGEAESIAYYRSIGDSATAEDMEEEFFWYVDTAVDKLSSLGLTVETARFSRLSWGLKAQKSN